MAGPKEVVKDRKMGQVNGEEAGMMRTMEWRMLRAFNKGIRDESEDLLEKGELALILISSLKAPVMLAAPKKWIERHNLEMHKDPKDDKRYEVIVNDNYSSRRSRYLIAIESTKFPNNSKFAVAREVGSGSRWQGLRPERILAMDERLNVHEGLQVQEEALVVMLGCAGVRSGINGGESKEYGAVALSLDPLDK
jgi:hypothetical protein